MQYKLYEKGKINNYLIFRIYSKYAEYYNVYNYQMKRNKVFISHANGDCRKVNGKVILS